MRVCVCRFFAVGNVFVAFRTKQNNDFPTVESTTLVPIPRLGAQPLSTLDDSTTRLAETVCMYVVREQKTPNSQNANEL